MVGGYSATELEINPHFEKIDFGPPIISLRQEIVRDLSTDLSHAYKIHEAIKTGNISKTQLQIGPVNPSHWLTTACRLCRLWILKPGLSRKNVEKLRLILKFIIGVYIPNLK